MSQQIFELLPKVMADIGGIGKENVNQHQRYNFRGIDDALNHVSPVLAKHGVSVSVNVDDHEMARTNDDRKTRYHVNLALTLTFYAPDGSKVENCTRGEAIDTNGDKATNKAMAAAMKYALFFGLVIPVDAGSVDDSDRDAKHEDAPKPEPKPSRHIEELKAKREEEGISHAEMKAALAKRGIKGRAPTAEECQGLYNEWQAVLDEVRTMREGAS